MSTVIVTDPLRSVANSKITVKAELAFITWQDFYNLFLNADLTCDNVSSCELCYNFNSLLNVFHVKLNLIAFQKTIQFKKKNRNVFSALFCS